MRRTLLPTALPVALLTALTLGVTPALLVAAPSAASAAVQAASPTPTLKAGAKGVAVLRVQKDLGVKQTGVVDKATVAAVKAFQRANRLPATGVVSPSTWSALVRAEKAVAAAKVTFTKQRATANAEIAKQRSRVVLEAGMLVHRPAADTKLLLGRLDGMRRTLDSAAASVAKAGTLAQVKAQSGWPGKIVTGTGVVAAQSSAIAVTRKDVFTLVIADRLDEILSQQDEGHSISLAAETAARTRALKAAEAYRLTVAPAAVTLVGSDPLSPAAKGRADVVLKAFRNAWTTPAGKAYEAALDAYADLVFN